MTPRRSDSPFKSIVSTSAPPYSQDSQPSSDSGDQHGKALKSSGACVHCKSLKVRCEFRPGERACRRCYNGNISCLSRDRKKRKPAPTQEDLQDISQSQDRQIESILYHIDSIRNEQKIKEWTTRASLDLAWDNSGPHRHQDGPLAESEVCRYFTNARARDIRKPAPPGIVKYCALYPKEIIELFSIYFDKINGVFSILDPGLHTAERLIWTSPFLFTVVCALAARYYVARPNLYQFAMEFAMDAASKALVDGSKSIDVCQAYLLMAVYPLPQKKRVEDGSWLLIAVAIRMAIELELHQPFDAACDERENLNRTRTWLNCFCVDMSHATQFGKIPLLHREDFLARHSREWYRSSPLSLTFDIYLSEYVEMLIVMDEFRTAVGDKAQQLRRKTSDIVAMSLDYDEKLARLNHLWTRRYAEDSKYMDPSCAYRGHSMTMISRYLRLVILSLGFQRAMKDGISGEFRVLQKSILVASEVIKIMTRRLRPTGRLCYAVAAHFLNVSFAAAFLLHLLRPQFLPLLDTKQQDDIIALVCELIDVLRSNDVALDGRHAPALYSQFLSSLLAKYRHRPVADSPAPSFANTVKTVPQYSEEGQQRMPFIYSGRKIADTSHLSDNYATYQQPEEAFLDFSMQHFVETVSVQNIIPNTHRSSFAPLSSMLDQWSNIDTGFAAPIAGQAWLDFT